MSVLAAVPARAPSGIPVLLRRLRATLMALAILAGAMALLVTWEEHTTVVAGTRTATAVIQTYAAGHALTDADSQAVQTISRGADPSGQYQADIAAAEQSLEQVAENNTTGVSGTQALQLIEGLVPAYTGLVEQADARYGARVPGEVGGSGAGVEDLWSASELMHQQILAGQDSLAYLRKSEQKTLASQWSSFWVSPWLNVLWILPALALLGRLVATQRLLRRQMRRMLSKYLTLASAAVIALCVTTSHVIVSEHAFGLASGPLTTVFTLQGIQTGSTDAGGQRALGQLIADACPRWCSAEQGEARAVAASDAKSSQSSQSSQKTQATAEKACATQKIPGCITGKEQIYAADAARVQSGYGTSMAVIAGLTVLLLLLIPLGLRRYLDEYRQA